jgi:hypothetical protein
MTFTREQKIKALEREIALRHKTYTKRMREGKMKAEEAAYQICVFEAILEDYQHERDGGTDLRSNGIN